MAAVNHFHAEQLTAQTTTSNTYGSRLSLSGLAANTNYLIIVRATLAVDSLTNKAYIRVTTADDSTISAKSGCVRS